jgi:hypothetical protein
MGNKEQGPPRKPKLGQKPASLFDEYKELVRTPAAVLLADGTLVLLALFIMAIVLLALQGFLVLGASPKVVDFLETFDTYSMTMVILVICFDTPIKILLFVIRGRKT